MHGSAAAGAPDSTGRGLAFGPLGLVIGATVLFGALLRGAGLLVALGALVVVSAYASRHFPWEVALALAAVLAGGGSPEELDARTRSESAKWKKVIEASTKPRACMA